MQYPVFQKKSILTATSLNSLVDVVKRSRVLPGVGIKLTETLNGTVISLSSNRSAGSSGEQVYPFKIEVYPVNESGETISYEASVLPGTINNLIAINHFKENNLRRFPFPKDSVQHVVLKAKSNGKQFTSCELAVQDDAPPAQPPTLFALPEEIEILLGVVHNSSVFQIVKTRLELLGKAIIEKDRDTPANPGEPILDVFYIWA